MRKVNVRGVQRKKERSGGLEAGIQRVRKGKRSPRITHDRIRDTGAVQQSEGTSTTCGPQGDLRGRKGRLKREIPGAGGAKSSRVST